MYISTSHLDNSKNLFYKKKPNWIRVKAPTSPGYIKTKSIMKNFNLATVCEEAACPNIGECWNQSHATFMILGRICTRKCTFCNIKTGIPEKLDHNEPKRVADAVVKLGLKHVVITSVDRDDLEDGGSQQFSLCIKEIRKLSPLTTIEILTPDFQRKQKAITIISDSLPDVFNHNLETVPRLYKEIRRGADYDYSLKLLESIKIKNPNVFTKSGLMVGLGEKFKEVCEVMNDMRRHNIDFLTIGQYLQPTIGHQPIARYVSLEEFEEYKNYALKIGFLMVSSSPLTRSSYHADEDFKILKENHKKYLRSVSL
tara:strand:+ start:498 stop:1433 length:936 start_codon:yes stop_codon:yes gene_type:complete